VLNQYGHSASFRAQSEDVRNFRLRRQRKLRWLLGRVTSHRRWLLQQPADGAASRPPAAADRGNAWL